MQNISVFLVKIMIRTTVAKEILIKKLQNVYFKCKSILCSMEILTLYIFNLTSHSCMQSIVQIMAIAKVVTFKYDLVLCRTADRNWLHMGYFQHSEGASQEDETGH